MGDNTSCPPGPDTTTKSTPNATLGDKDVNGDGTLDFYMGEHQFTLPGCTSIVRKWCINKPAAGGALQDFFTLEIVTIMNGMTVTVVMAGAPT